MLSCFSHFWLCANLWTVAHGILQARILEWTAISFSRGTSQPRDRTRVSCIADRQFTVWAAGKPWINLKSLWILDKIDYLNWIYENLTRIQNKKHQFYTTSKMFFMILGKRHIDQRKDRPLWLSTSLR